jgi:hypothetical protein
MNAAVVDLQTGIVQAVIVADPSTDGAPAGTVLVEVPDDVFLYADGFTWTSAGDFQPYPPSDQ